MIQKAFTLLQFFTRAPVFPNDEEKTSLAFVLQSYMVILGFFALIALPVALIVFDERRIGFSIILSVTIFTGAVWYVVQRGFVRQVALVASVVWWLIPTILISISGGTQSLDWSFYIPGTVAAALFYGLPGALIYSGAALSVSLLFVALVLSGVNLPHLFQFSAVSSWFLLAFNLGLTLLPITIYLHRLSAALATARKELAERQHYQAELASLNDELEQRVRERTAELQATNREIEAYSYTVSHDLRTPIRSIVSYTQIVLAEHADKLPQHALEDLEQVRQSGLQMAHIVQGMEEYLGVRKKTLEMQALDMRMLALEVWEELRQGKEKERELNFSVGDLPECQGDPKLIRIVWRKLLDNAIKFTKHTDACIEVGSLPNVQGSIYFVRDNGAGFDMRYANKIFNIFQRLHHFEDFPGTGLGLAIAKRIIEHHHGHIWVKSAPGNGATFFFTLADTT